MINKLLLSAAIVLSGATTIEAAQKKSAKVEKQLAAQCDAGLRSITEDAARAHVYFLADDLLEGAVQASAVRASQSSISSHRFDRLA